METNIKESGKMTKERERVSSYGPMETPI